MSKVILIHGNGGGTGQDNWQPYVKLELEKLGFEVLSPNFPDAVKSRKEYWLPYLSKLGVDKDTILIGHSSGAVAIMKYTETNKLLGSVLVGAYCTDLGYDSEKESGYFDEPWKWDIIRNNQEWIIQFASTDDPYIPIEESRHIRDNLSTIYYEFTDEGHFGEDMQKKEFPELVDAIKKVLK